jgi:MFS family permease
VNNKILEVLKIKPFSYLLLAETFSQLAVNMLNFVLVLVVYSLTNSSTAVAGVILSFTIPQLLFGLLAGVFVDNWNKKKVLILTNVLRALLVFILIFGLNNLPAIYILSFAISVVSQFFIPAETPMIPTLVRRDLLLSANALFGMIIYGSIFLAYALSGPILLIFGKTAAFLTLGGSFLLASLFASLIDTRKTHKEIDLVEIGSGVFSEIKNALLVVKKARILINALLLLTLSQILTMVLAVIGPGYADQLVKIRVEEFPVYFVTPAIIGTALGAVLIGAVYHNHPRQNVTRVGLFLLGLAILILPHFAKIESREFIQTLNTILPRLVEITVIHILVVLSFVMGLANSLIFIPSNTTLQEETPEDFRGKAYGALNTMVGIFSLIPIILVGGLADVLGIKAVITGIGIIVILLATANIFKNK